MNGITRELTIDDLDLFVCNKQGEDVDEDCLCDSTFIKKIVETVANEIRNYYFRVTLTSTIYLVIDNAGGHGTNGTVEEYRCMIFQEYNIKLFHQVPNSPKTNLKDLGV